MAKKKKENQKMILVLVIIVVVIVLLNIILKISSNKANPDTVEEQDNGTAEEIVQNNEDAVNLAKLKNMEERDRMEYYFQIFLDYIESERYDKAYDLLYTDFKKNYFPTVEDFTKYAETKFSEMSNIEHYNIERNGDVYVLWIYITDAINGKPGEQEEMNIVIRENDYNDFELSFSVK